MAIAFFVFIVSVGAIVGGYAAVTYLPGYLEQRRLAQRLTDVATPIRDPGTPDQSILRHTASGPLPALDRALEQSGAAVWLSRLIQQSGTRTTPSGAIVAMLAAMISGAVIASMVSRYLIVIPVAAAIGGAAPIAWLLRRRSNRMKRFEEQFPEALDLLSRAIRAGHAFQTAMGMVAEELPTPVGPEFKTTFEQQNFGLPLRDALDGLALRVPILDVRFFITAVMIQRDTGGNLSEILDNLGHVVRERFKIRRQIRVHTAHGRFTAYVLLALPAVLAVVLNFINPDHMQLLFREHMGHMMLAGTIVLQTIGYFWIRQVIKIEV
jgi:tight adherence protein B